MSGQESAEAKNESPRLTKVLRMLAFIVIPAVFIGFIGYSLFRTAPPSDLIDEPAPDFDLPLLEGGRLTSKELKGEIVVLNFWASWCIPCRQEAPTLETKWRTYRDRGVKFVGVNVQDTSDDAKQFVKEFGLTFPMVRDVDLKLYRKVGVRGMPETFFIDHTYKFSAVESGRQVGSRGATKVLGAIEPALLDSQIQRLIEKKNAEAASSSTNFQM